MVKKAESTVAPLVLVDGSSYLYRAFHAMSQADLRNSAGQPTGAIRGVINMLRRLQNDYPDSDVIAVFDAKGKTFRDDIYPEYKATRPPMPDELRSQIEPTFEIIRAMGMPLLIVPNVEADDVIGTIAKQVAAEGKPVVVSTGDKDMAQLVEPNITLVNTMTETTLDRDGVMNKFGVPPEHIIDYLALMGDKSDNIPGVAGVGEKTAVGLLQGVGSLDDIYNNLEAVRELPIRGAKKLPEKLLEHKENAYLSYELATIKTDVDMGLAEDELKPKEADYDKLLALFEEYEFRTLLEELRAQGPSAKASEVEIKYETVFTEEQLKTWAEKLAAAELFAFDTETTDIDYMRAKLVGLSFAIEPGRAAYVPMAHSYAGAPEQLSQEQVFAILGPILADENIKKVGHNLKYDLSVLANHGIELKGIAFDTMLESYVVNSTDSRHDMDTVALRRLRFKTTHYEDIAGKGAKQITFDQVGIEEAAHYAAEDADITLRLHENIWPDLQARSPLDDIYQDIEIPLLEVLSKIERTGVVVDDACLLEQSHALGERLQALEENIYELAGETFNVGSPKQLGKILFEKLELPVKKKTKSGVPSTAEEILQDLALDYELPRVIMDYRGLSKLKSTYTDKLPAMIYPTTGRVHTSYHQAVTATGRLSSSDPNLQNIPIRTEDGRRIRTAFVAESGNKILAADYSQIELRIMAHLSQDENLLKAFADGMDVHRATAAEVFGCTLDEVSDDQRRSAKAINFGLIYGMSAFGLAKQLHIGRRQAQEYVDLYFERYPGVKHYMDSTRDQARKDGYVETVFGRRLYLPNITDRNFQRRQAAERTAINAPMQGTAADIIKKAMIATDEWLENGNVNAKMIMQVHDELVLEVAAADVDSVSKSISELMMNAAKLDVPLIVDVGVGDNWEEAH